MSKQESLFKTKVVPGKPGSGNLFDEEIVTYNGPVKCLGLEFENDAARRTHFIEELRKKLQDPEFRKIEGFPIGEDEDILKLSDPPYYTACPNPWIADFIEEWESQKPEKPADYHYHREPFAADVSEGKNEAIYNAHSYHTKVPHKAIMRYILHYTEPGDILFDGFCGTGMTGVAAQMCGDRNEVASLGYQIKTDGTILQEEVDEVGNAVWVPFSKLGARKAILNDLAPAATFIALNYNKPVDVIKLKKDSDNLIKELKKKTGWMWETEHDDGKKTGKVNYVVWSEVYSCSECTSEVVFFNEAFTKINDKKTIYCDEFPCPNCGTICAKNPSKKSGVSRLERVVETINDPVTKTVVQRQKRVPVRINYSVGTKRFEKEIDTIDQERFDKIASLDFSNAEIPLYRMPEGDEARRNDDEGIGNIHQFQSR